MAPAWHALDTASVLQLLHTSKDGLDTATARSRLLRDGGNTLRRPKKKPQLAQFFSHLTSPIIFILGLAAVIKLFLRQVGDAAAILFVVALNACLGFFQEKRASTSLESLRKLSALRAKAYRDGAIAEVDAETIVPGDVLYLESGTRVCADCRLLETHALDVDESMLTGESSAVRKNADLLLHGDIPIVEQHTMVFAGTTITRGRARAVVTATGQNTQVAQIVIETEKAAPPKSPLERRMNSFAHAIALLTLCMMGIIIVIGLLQGYSLSDLVMICVSLTVSAVPEGLPIAVTIVLSIGLFKMAQRNAVVRKLGTVETLGCTTVICTDKTGTLTENAMMVGRASLGMKEGLAWSARIAYFCSETRLDGNGFIGDPVEASLMRYAIESGVLDKEGWHKELILPFESEQQLMACRISKNGKKYTVWKGSLEALQKRCQYMWHGDAIVPFDMYHMQAVAQEMAQDGLKVLCLAYEEAGDEALRDRPGITFAVIEEKNGSDLDDFSEEVSVDTSEEKSSRDESIFPSRTVKVIPGRSLTMAGIVGLVDPPREGVGKAIHACQEAGIRVVMITGDDPRTAAAIAKDIGLKIDPHYPPCTGVDLDRMNDAALYKAVSTTSIFARVTAHHKLRIVQQLQKHGEVAAMTGDGVNDAPPLAQADIGIAMGDGTDVAKEASAMVIIDNNFSTIVAAIRQGRVMFKSLQQMVVYLLTTCFGGIMTIGAAVLLRLPLPVLPLQLLWINLVTDGTTTIPLSLEGEHGNIMNTQPRKQRSPFISRLMFGRSLLSSIVMMSGTLGVFIWVLVFRHGAVDYARTMAFTTLALFQILNALNARSVRRSLFFNYVSASKGRVEHISFFQNYWLVIVVAVCLILQVLAVELPFLQETLHTTPLFFQDWMCLIAIALSIILIVELHKAAMFFFTKPSH